VINRLYQITTLIDDRTKIEYKYLTKIDNTNVRTFMASRCWATLTVRCFSIRKKNSEWLQKETVKKNALHKFVIK